MMVSFMTSTGPVYEIPEKIKEIDEMIVKKQNSRGKEHYSDSDVGHIILFGSKIQCNCVVRDWIFPRNFAFIHVDNGNLIIEPTDDDNGYKISKQGHQVRITYCYAKRFLEIPERKRIYCEKTDDGRILCKVKEAAQPCGANPNEQ